MLEQTYELRQNYLGRIRAMHKPFEMSDLEPIHSLLTEMSTLTLATLDPDGTPRATPLFFAADERLNLFFFSSLDSQHCRNLERNIHAAVGLYPAVDNWRRLRGLQMKGRVDILVENQRREAYSIYKARFPFITELSATILKAALHCFQPKWVRLIDNRRGFGHHQEWKLL